jgi:sugar lactone lactonase YvrE
MRKIFLLPLLAFAVLALLAPGLMNDAVADSGIVIKPNGAKKFAVMPAGFPEGLTINTSNGEVIVGTFDVTGGDNKLVRLSKTGNVVDELLLATPVLGLAYNPADDKIYICNNGVGEIQRIPAEFDGSTAIETVAAVPDVDANAGNEFPNDLTFDTNGDLYYSDSFQGAVFRIADPATNCPGGGCTTDTVAHDAALATTGFPPFGANGVAIREDTLFVANTGNDQILMIDLDAGFPVTPAVLAQSINGADGVIYDADNDLLWVAANQADQVVGLNPDTGRPVAELGEFLGINNDGSARGLLFPASLAIANNKILVTNLAIPVFKLFFGSVLGGEPEEDVTKYTVSRINIPEFDD